MAVCRQRQHEQRHVFLPTKRALSAGAGPGAGAKGESEREKESKAERECRRQVRARAAAGKARRHLPGICRETLAEGACFRAELMTGLGRAKAPFGRPRPPAPRLGCSAEGAGPTQQAPPPHRCPSPLLFSHPFWFILFRELHLPQELRRARLRGGPRSAPAAALLAPTGGNGERGAPCARSSGQGEALELPGGRKQAQGAATGEL